ncbi:glycosyltransferase [Limibaculum sp. FT325]|uniref:glycosyltransferase family protein n=1 Tax=Thermohalobaculum sediminis TaxID=2939436 RepID=UPI0020C072D9|nr:glycosyltransferase [Limibaculum sediminis]MCL5778143.1 glycosyltransferase [Limibaculum sediminis]
MTRVLFLVSHLAGSGHLVRILALARAVTAAGAVARVVSGGRPLGHIGRAGVDLVQIPPLAVRDLDFSRLLAPDGEPADAAFMATRGAAIAAAIHAFRPDALVTETFPLGRRSLAAEFEAAISAARRVVPRVAVLASVRDVPEPPSAPDRLAAAADRLRTLYDRLIVHGDAGFLPLSATWPLPADLAAMTAHAGYVAEPAAPAEAPAPDGEVLVSAGGGDRGRGLLSMAAQAAKGSRLRWRLLVGGADAATEASALAARYPAPNLAVEPARADYRARLARAAVSVSLAGYNTVTDLAPLATPAILVPDETAGEREQAIRAAALAGLPGVAVRPLAGLAPGDLAALAEAMAGRPRPPLPLALDGAARAAVLILETARRKAAA